MAIGNWGMDVVFSVSDLRVLTFDNLNQNVGSEWATHSRIGGKDQVEYLRPKLRKLTFDIDLNASFGVRPRTVIERLELHSELGHVFPFVIGGRRLGRHRWRMTDVGEAWETIYNRGELYRAKVSVTMEEYV